MQKEITNKNGSQVQYPQQQQIDFLMTKYSKAFSQIPKVNPLQGNDADEKNNDVNEGVNNEKN